MLATTMPPLTWNFMKLSKLILLAFAAVAAGFTACDNSSQIGMSIAQDDVSVVIDSAFTMTGKSVEIGSVQSRTVSQLLGRIDAPGFGRLSSTIVCQFMPSSQMDTLLTSEADIDSLVLYFYTAAGEYVGDSIAPMGLNIYRLTKNLPSPIYSNFDPEGYYDKSAPMASKIYNISNNTIKNAGDTTYTEGVEIAVQMPLEFGQELYNAYKANPSNFSSPTSFVDNVFKGIYVENSFGSGRLIRTSTTLMTLYYHYEEDDSVYSASGNYFAVTPEIVTNNDIDFQMSDELKARAEAGEQLVVAPVGYEVQARFPAPEIIASYKSSQADLKVLNSLSFFLPATGITNDYNFSPPSYLLLVLTKDKDEFFAKNKLPDSTTSFYATYSSTTGGYSFGDMRAYLLDLLDKDEITEEDYTFSIIPVSATFETSSSSSSYYYYYYYGTTASQTLSLLTPYVSAPCMAQLLLDQAKIKLTYSTQTVE